MLKNSRAENAALRAQLAQQQKSLRMHRLVTLILLGILLLCALALLVERAHPIDRLDPHINKTAPAGGGRYPV